jgi:hypothetical protein
VEKLRVFKAPCHSTNLSGSQYEKAGLALANPA